MCYLAGVYELTMLQVHLLTTGGLGSGTTKSFICTFNLLWFIDYWWLGSGLLTARLICNPPASWESQILTKTYKQKFRQNKLGQVALR